MLNKIILSAVLAVSLLSIGCSDSKKEMSSETKKANALVSKTIYNLKDLNNTIYNVQKELDGFTLINHKNKIVIYDIFATWCPPCRAEATHLSNLQNKYKDDLIIIGLTIEEGIQATKLQGFATKYNATYPLSISKDNNKLIRAITSAVKAGPQFPIPMMVVYVNGKYETHYVGATPEEMIDSDLQQMIKEKNEVKK